MKKIAILGSTGSIGSNALKVIESNPEEYKVLALTAGRNIGLLMKQIIQFQPIAVAVSEESLADILEIGSGAIRKRRSWPEWKVLFNLPLLRK